MSNNIQDYYAENFKKKTIRNDFAVTVNFDGSLKKFFGSNQSALSHADTPSAYVLLRIVPSERYVSVKWGDAGGLSVFKEDEEARKNGEFRVRVWKHGVVTIDSTKISGLFGRPDIQPLLTYLAGKQKADKSGKLPATASVKAALQKLEREMVNCDWATRYIDEKAPLSADELDTEMLAFIQSGIVSDQLEIEQKRQRIKTLPSELPEYKKALTLCAERVLTFLAEEFQYPAYQADDGKARLDPKRKESVQNWLKSDLQDFLTGDLMTSELSLPRLMGEMPEIIERANRVLGAESIEDTLWIAAAETVIGRLNLDALYMHAHNQQKGGK